MLIFSQTLESWNWRKENFFPQQNETKNKTSDVVKNYLKKKSQFLSRHSNDHPVWNDEKKKKNICKKLIH